ncbi:hypothetical protein [Brevibacillus massiliensis]|uniref:hypothetical protein n=1 Tax=Brevibacillus massiliensis TaxID=1118054 RepID=UPI0002F400A3|nr:hypothetical protein [Brevibacillus massiliensis]
MFGIVARRFEKTIKEALPDPPVFQSTGETIREELDAAARTAIQTLIIEVDCAAGTDLITALRSFRRQRPHTRILVLAPDRKPGDTTIAMIVSLGIYDIVAPEIVNMDEEDGQTLILSSLSQSLQRVATYADATRWERWGMGNESEETKETKQQVILRERLVGTPVIAVAGATRGSGCTYLAIQLALFLTRYGTVACIELQKENMAGSLPFLGDGQSLFQIRSIPEIDFAYVKKTTEILRAKKYDWVVVDVGCWEDRTEETLEEWERATLACLTVATSPWCYFQYLKQMESLPHHRPDWNVFLQHPSEKQRRDIQKDMKKFGVPVYPEPYQPDVLTLTEDNATIYQRALQDVLPKDTIKKRFSFRLPLLNGWRST